MYVYTPMYYCIYELVTMLEQYYVGMYICIFLQRKLKGSVSDAL